MKRLLLSAFLLTSISAVVLANTNKSVTPAIAMRSDDGRHISASEVPAEVIQSFNARFPTATRVRWEVERENGGKVYEAEFTMNGKRFKAEFLPDGTFLGKQRDNSGSGSSN